MRISDQENEQEEVAEDDRCFVCGDGGRLVLCDFPGCPRVYHQVTHHGYPTFPSSVRIQFPIHVGSRLTYLHTSSLSVPQVCVLTTFPVPLGEELFAEDYESTWYCPRHQCACCDALQLHAEPRFEKYVCTYHEDSCDCVFSITTTLSISTSLSHTSLDCLPSSLTLTVQPFHPSSFPRTPPPPPSLSPSLPLLLCLQRIAGSSMSVGCINPTSTYTNPHSADAAASIPGQGLTRHYPVLERCVLSSLLSCYTKTTITSIINISVLFRLYPASPSFIDFHHTLIHTSADPDSLKQQ